MPRVDSLNSLSEFDQELIALCNTYGVPLIIFAYLRPVVGTNKYSMSGRLLTAIEYNSDGDDVAGDVAREKVTTALQEYCESIDLPTFPTGNN